MTIEQFGRSIKAKYPQYNDVGDAELGQKMLVKYPQYNDMVQANSPEKPARQGFLSLVGHGIASGVTQAANAAIGAGKGVASTVLNTGHLFNQGLDQSVGRVTSALTGRGFAPTQEAPAVAQKVNTALTPGNQTQKAAKFGEQAGEFLVPGSASTKIGKVADLAVQGSKLAPLARFGAKAATEAGIAGGITAAQGGSGEEIKNAALFGAGSSLASSGISAVLKSLPETAWSNILKRTSTQVSKNPELPNQAAKTGLIGTKQGILKQSKNAIQQLEVSLDEILKTKNDTIDGQKVAKYLGDLKNVYSNIPGETSSVGTIDQLQQEIANKGSLSLLDANKLKRDIYSLIEKSYGKGILEISAKTEGQKLIASGIKQEIEKIAPEIKELNRQQAVYIQIKKAIERQLSQGEGRTIAGLHIGYGDLITGVLGTGAGVLQGKPLLGIGLVAARKVLGSTLSQSTASRIVDYFNNLSPTQKSLFYNGLKGLTLKTISSSGKKQ